MPDVVDTPQDPPTPPADQPPPAPQADPPPDPPAGDPPEDINGEDKLPDWARKELTRARTEAANYRTKLRDAEGSLAKAKTPEEFEAAKAELTTRVAELERSVLVATAARKFGLPDELADVLKGATVEELEAHAKKLQKFVNGTDEPRLGGGLNPGDDNAAEGDPVAAAQRALRRRR